MSSADMAKYLNQNCVWEKKGTTKNAYGEVTRTSQTIKCRKERRQKLVRTATGKEIISTTTVYAIEPIQVDDKIDGKVVLDVMDYVTNNGETVGYEVLL